MSAISTEKKRVELYGRESVRKLLSRFSKEDIKPIFDIKYGYRYPEVEKITNLSPAAAVDFLDSLVKVNILERNFYGRTTFCPKCGSVFTTVSHTCPNCGSRNTDRKTLIEHIRCGYIGPKDKFEEKGKLVCPSCKVPIPPEEQREVGLWWVCMDCDSTFDVPKFSHFCHKCRKSFEASEVKFRNAYVYRISRVAKEEGATKRTLQLVDTKQVFEKMGYEVKMPGQLKGSSGVIREFDLVGTKKEGEGPVVADILTSKKPINEGPVSSFFAKVYDSSPARSLLIVSPELTPKAKKLTDLYGIVVIQTVKLGVAKKKLEELLKK